MAKNEETTPETQETTPKIMSMPLPAILDELENYIRQVEEAVKQSQAAAEESKESAAEAKEAAAKAREAALKAATDFAEALGGDIAEVRKIAIEARDTANLVGMALMTAADGTQVTSENLIEALKPRFEFKK